MDDEKIRKPANDPRVLLRLSEHFLWRRHLDDCRNYAHQIDPNFPGVTEILAVADVLLATNHRSSTGIVRNWYDVLQLDRYTNDSDLITQRFNRLCGLLNPSNNKLPFADEAFDVVCDAWYVLSNPVNKLEFDDLLKKVLDDEQLKVDFDFDFDCVFWTACPYCYYLYEFPRVYVELCLRCPNEKCCKAFTCVEIDRPPVEVLKEGKYVCAGFLALGYQSSCWNPFSPLSDKKARCSDGNDNFVTISDDDDEEEDNGGGGIETNGDESLIVGGEGVNGDAGGLKMEVDMQPKKVSFGRRKSVVKNTKKVTGAGNRVRKQGFVHPEQTDGCEFF